MISTEAMVLTLQKPPHKGTGGLPHYCRVGVEMQISTWPPLAGMGLPALCLTFSDITLMRVLGYQVQSLKGGSLTSPPAFGGMSGGRATDISMLFAWSRAVLFYKFPGRFTKEQGWGGKGLFIFCICWWLIQFQVWDICHIQRKPRELTMALNLPVSQPAFRFSESSYIWL